MIRRVLTMPDGEGERAVVWGLTMKGLALLAFEYAATFVAIALAAMAFVRANTETTARIRLACQETQQRHENAERRFDAQVAAIPNARQRAQARASRNFTLGLIDALEPVENCEARAQRLANP